MGGRSAVLLEEKAMVSGWRLWALLKQSTWTDVELQETISGVAFMAQFYDASGDHIQRSWFVAQLQSLKRTQSARHENDASDKAGT